MELKLNLTKPAEKTHIIRMKPGTDRSVYILGQSDAGHRDALVNALN